MGSPGFYEYPLLRKKASMIQVHYLRNGFLQCVLKCDKPLNCLEIVVDVEDGRFSVLVERTHYADAL